MIRYALAIGYASWLTCRMGVHVDFGDGCICSVLSNRMPEFT